MVAGTTFSVCQKMFHFVIVVQQQFFGPTASSTTTHFRTTISRITVTGMVQNGS
jgi:hypothetical protein